MSHENGRKAAGYLIITLIWSSTWYAIKVGLETTPPFWGVALRFGLATVLLAIWRVLKKEPFPFDRNAIRLYTILGLFTFSIPYGLVYLGEQHLSSGLTSILFAVYPLVVATGSHFMLPNERLNAFKAAGIAIGITGLLVIFWSDFHFGDGSALGISAIVLSTVISGTSLVITKRTGMHISPVSANLGGLLFGLPVLFGLAIVTEGFNGFNPGLSGVLAVIYLAMFGTVIAFVIYYWLLKRMEALYIAFVPMITPVLAVILGAVMLNEPLSLRTLAGGAMVLAGVFVTHIKELQRRVTA